MMAARALLPMLAVAAAYAPRETRMSDEEFLTKWSAYVTKIDTPSAASTKGRALQAGEFAGLFAAIKAITGAWESIVKAFGTSYKEQIVDKEFHNGWDRYKAGTTAFKGAGLPKSLQAEYFADIMSHAGVPSQYAADFQDQLKWINAFDSSTWTKHNTQYTTGTGGTDMQVTIFANNRADGKMDLTYLTCSQSFHLADNYFVISESKSILGGIFSSTKLKFKMVPAGITDQQLMFVSDYFALLAYQNLALAAGAATPPDPNFPPSVEENVEEA
jgi:hypothetical protein